MNKGPDNEDDVCLPFEVFDGNGPGELVKKTSCINKGTLESHTLGTDLKVDDFDGVEGLERSKVERVDTSEDEDECQHGIAGSLVAVDSIASLHTTGFQ